MIIQRQINLLNDILGTNNENNISILSNKYSISERMLRYDISEINQLFIKYFKKEILEIKDNLILKNISNLEYLEYIDLIPFEEYSLNSIEREYLIMLDIFLFDNNFKLQDIVNRYNISKTTIRTAIKNINNNLKEFDIYLSFEQNNIKGYTIIGSELNIRKYLINLVRNIKMYFQHNHIMLKIIREKINKFSKNIDEIKAKELLTSFLKTENIKINDEAFEIITYYIFFSKNRNYYNKNIVNDDIDNKLFLINTVEYKRILDKFLSEDFFENDCQILTDFYLGLYNFNEKYSFFLNWIKIEQFVEDILKNLSIEFKIDFSKDKILRKELLHHIKPAIYRMKNKLNLGESIIEDVKKEYNDIYVKTKKALIYLEDILDITLDDEEIAFISIMLKRAIDRNYQLNKSEKIKILIVCGFGYSSSKFIYENLTDNFYVEVIDIIPFNQLVDYKKLKDIDLIVTTLDFELNTHEVIKVNAIFKNEDFEKLEKYGLARRKMKISEKELLEFIEENKNNNKITILNNMRKKFKNYIYQDLENKKQKRIYDFLNENNVKFNIDANNLDEALEEISSLMFKNNYTDKGYDKNLKQQIIKYGSYIQIGKKTILPHGELGVNVNNTGFVLVTLKNPIDFFDNKISIIIALASNDNEEHIQAILDINSCMKKSGFEDELLKINDYKNLEKYLKYILKGDKQNEDS